MAALRDAADCGKALGIAAAVRDDHCRYIDDPCGVGVGAPRRSTLRRPRRHRQRPRRQPPIRTRQRPAATSSIRSTPAWVLLGAFLVFGMQAGFTMLEAGFCRNRETVNVLVECMFDTCVCGLLHWGWGFAFMFGGGNAFIGWHLPGDPSKSLLFMKDVSVLTTYAATGIPILAHYLFQFAFADCASTICSGAMVGRTRFMGDVLYSIGVSGFIYPIFGHWCWGPDGFLATMGSPGNFLSSLGMNFHDFAGSTVVHSIGGWVAIAGAIMLGPRLGRKFKRDGGGPMLPHDLTIAVIGGLILWFGWYGFNPCSTLSLMDNAGVGRVATNTTLAACTGGLAAIFLMCFRTKKWDTTAIINGFLAGLVGITCPCYWVSGLGACAIGAVAGVHGHPGDGFA